MTGPPAVTLDGHDELLAQILLYVAHVLRGGVPYVAQHIAELDPIVLASPEHPSVVLVLTQRALSLPPLLLLIEDPFALLDELEGHRDRKVSHLVKGAKEIDAFDGSTLAVIVMPADQLALISVGLLLNGIVHDQHAILGVLQAAHQRFDQLPQGGRAKLFAREESGDFVVADLSAGHG